MRIFTEGLFPKRIGRNYTAHDEYIKSHVGVCPAIIAFNRNITERFVIGRQRRLGLRKLTGNTPKSRRYE